MLLHYKVDDKGHNSLSISDFVARKRFVFFFLEKFANFSPRNMKLSHMLSQLAR